MNKNQKGFSIVEALIVIAVIGLIGVVGWLVYDRQKVNNVKQTSASNSEDTKPVESNSSKNTELPEGYSKYSIGNSGVSLVYPTSWGEAKQVAESMGGGYDINGMNVRIAKDNAVVVNRSFNAPSSCTYSSGSWIKSGEYPPESCEPSILAVSGIKAQGFSKGAFGAYGFTYGINLKGDNFLLVSDSILSDGTIESDTETYPSAADINTLKAGLDKNIEILISNNTSLFE